jgi:hypothetical protein
MGWDYSSSKQGDAVLRRTSRVISVDIFAEFSPTQANLLSCAEIKCKVWV